MHWFLAQNSTIAQNIAPTPSLDGVMLANFLLGALCLLFFNEQRRHRMASLLLSICMVAMATFALIRAEIGAGLVLLIGALMAFGYWRERGRRGLPIRAPHRSFFPSESPRWASVSRLSRMFEN